MARMRYIKPEFWTDSVIVGLSMEARLLYIGTWNFALCDHGHLEDDALQIKMKVFPADNVDVPAELDSLISTGRIRRLTGSDGRKYLHIIRLDSHQKTDPRFTPRCPACNDPALTSTNAHADSLPNSGENGRALPNSPEPSRSLPQEGKGGEGKGEGGEGELLPSPAAPSRTRDPHGFGDFWEQYPRKVGKDDARKAYVKALKRATSAHILLSARRYASDPNLPEKAFIPHPSKWLNDGRWEDEPLPPRSSPTGSNGRPTTDDRVAAGLTLAQQIRAEQGATTTHQIGA